MEKSQPYQVEVNDKILGILTEKDISDLDIIKTDEGEYHLLHNNKSYKIKLKGFDPQAKQLHFECRDTPYTVSIKDKLDLQVSAMGYDLSGSEAVGEVKAPMPGLVLKVMVEAGQEVEEETPLMILEAMKMENVIKSPGKGTIESVNVKPGEKVEKGRMLLKFN